MKKKKLLIIAGATAGIAAAWVIYSVLTDKKFYNSLDCDDSDGSDWMDEEIDEEFN